MQAISEQPHPYREKETDERETETETGERDTRRQQHAAAKRAARRFTVSA